MERIILHRTNKYGIVEHEDVTALYDQRRRSLVLDGEQLPLLLEIQSVGNFKCKQARLFVVTDENQQVPGKFRVEGVVSAGGPKSSAFETRQIAVEQFAAANPLARTGSEALFNATIIDQTTFGRLPGQLLVAKALRTQARGYEVALRVVFHALWQVALRIEDGALNERQIVRTFARVCSIFPLSTTYVGEEPGADSWVSLSDFDEPNEATGDCEDLAITFLQHWSVFAKLAKNSAKSDAVLRKVNTALTNGKWRPGLAVATIHSHTTGISAHVLGIVRKAGAPPLLVELTSAYPIDYESPVSAWWTWESGDLPSNGHAVLSVSDAKGLNIYRDAMMLLEDPITNPDVWGEFGLGSVPLFDWAEGLVNPEVVATVMQRPSEPKDRLKTIERFLDDTRHKWVLNFTEVNVERLVDSAKVLRDLDESWRVIWLGRCEPDMRDGDVRMKLGIEIHDSVVVWVILEKLTRNSKERMQSGAVVANSRIPKDLFTRVWERWSERGSMKMPLNIAQYRIERSDPEAVVRLSENIRDLHAVSRKTVKQLFNQALHPASEDTFAVATRDIKTGTEIGELIGELRLFSVFDKLPDFSERLFRVDHELNHPMSISDDRRRVFVFDGFIIDQTVFANETSGVRRSYGSLKFKANCRPELVDMRVVLVATQDIVIGEEVLCV